MVLDQCKIQVLRMKYLNSEELMDSFAHSLSFISNCSFNLYNFVVSDICLL